MIKVFIKNIMDSKKDLPGQWILLPAKAPNINNVLFKIGICNTYEELHEKEEYSIYDYHTDWNIKLEGNENIWSLNNLALKLEQLDKKNAYIIQAIINKYEFDEAVKIIYNDDYIIYNDNEFYNKYYDCDVIDEDIIEIIDDENNISEYIKVLR